MLWARSYVQTFQRIDIASIRVTNIIWIVIIGNWMDDININATDCIYDFHKAIESNPGIVIDGDAEILVDCETAERNSSQSIRLVQLMQTATGYIDIEIAWYREHTNAPGCKI